MKRAQHQSHPLPQKLRHNPLSASLLAIGIGMIGAGAHGQPISLTSGNPRYTLSGDETVSTITVDNGVNGVISGAGNTLTYSGATNGFVVGGNNAGGQSLDLSGLSNFVFDNAGQSVSVGGVSNTVSSSGSLTLASGSNVITASSFNVGSTVNNGGAGARNSGTVLLGADNVINADTVNVGTAAKTSGSLTFQSGVANGTLVLRGTDADSAVANWNIGANGNSGYTNTTGNVDLRTGTLDAKVGNLTIGQASSGSYSGVGTLTLGDGVLDAETISLGLRNGTSGSGSASGTLTIGDATVRTQTLIMGTNARATGTATAVVNLNGGELRAQAIQAGAGNATRTFNWNGGTLGNYASGDDMEVSIPTITLAANGGQQFNVEGEGAKANVSSALGGAGGFTKTGAGTLVLNGINTYTGDTQVNAGTLAVNGSILSRTTVASGGTLAGDGTVAGDIVSSGIVAPGSAGTPGAGFGDLTVRGNYTGHDSKLVLNTVLGDDGSLTDRLVIDGGNASGDTGVVIKRAGGDGAQTHVGIQVIAATNGAITNADAFHLDAASDGYRKGFGTVSAGGYDYMLKRSGNGGNAQDWYLVSSAAPVEPPVDPVDPKEPEDLNLPGKPQPRQAPEPDAYLGNAMTAILAPVHSLHQRQGQSPGMTGEGAMGADGGIDGATWARVEGTATWMRDDNGRDLSGNGITLHAGSDVMRFKAGDEGNVRLGVMGLLSNNLNWSSRQLWNPLTNTYQTAQARGSVDGYNVGVYGTWYGHANMLTGPYVDTWFMYGQYNNTVGGSLTTDSYRSSTLTGSIEAGYSFPLYQQGGTNVYLEPQAQVVFSNYRAGEHKAPAGLVGKQNANSVLTRLGVRLHGTNPEGPTREMRPFIEANWWHGPVAQSLTVDGNAFSMDLPSNRLELKVGLQGQLSKQWSVSATGGVESNLGGYTVLKGQIAAKYSWK